MSTEYPQAFLEALLDDSRLTPNQRAVVCVQVYGMSGRRIDPGEVYSTSVGTPVEFGSTFVMLGTQSANREWFFNRRWYPVILKVQFVQDHEHFSRTVVLHINLSLCESSFGVAFCVYTPCFSTRPASRWSGTSSKC